MGKGPTGKSWVQAQAEAQRAQRAKLVPDKKILVEESKMKMMGTKMGELIKSVMVLNERLRRVAGWNALHVQRIVQLRGELREQWERSVDLEGQVLELRLALGQSMGGGYAVKATYQRDGEWVTEWALITTDEPVTSIATLEELADTAVVPARYTFNMEGAQLSVVAELDEDEIPAAAPTDRHVAAQEKVERAIERAHPSIARLVAEQNEGAAMGKAIAEAEDRRSRAEFGHLADDSGVVHTPDPAVGVNQPPEPSTGLGEEG